MKRVTRHLQHYLPLIGILVAGFLGFWLFSYDQAFQMGVIIAVSVAYVVWGIVHHYLHKDLYLAVVIEYTVVALLGIVIVFSLIFNV